MRRSTSRSTMRSKCQLCGVSTPENVVVRPYGGCMSIVSYL